MTRARAADGKMTINGVAYSYRSIQRTGRVNPIDVSNSEGIPGDVNGVTAPGYSSTLPDILGCEFTVSQAFFDDVNNPYAAPINLREGTYYDLSFFPTGAGGPRSSGRYLCIETGEQGTVNQGALITNARFRSDTVYSTPRAN